MQLRKILFFTEFSLEGKLFEPVFNDPSRIFVDQIRNPI
jgi:hypothetical protein